MNFAIERKDSLVIFTLKSRNLDSEISSQLKAELLIVCQPNIKGLIFDLAEVEYVDSSGLSALLLADRQLRDYDVQITLVGASDSVKSLLDISRLSELFQFQNTVEDAINSYKE